MNKLIEWSIRRPLNKHEGENPLEILDNKFCFQDLYNNV